MDILWGPLIYLPQVESGFITKRRKRRKAIRDSVLNAWHTVNAQLMLNEGPLVGYCLPRFHTTLQWHWFNHLLYRKAKGVMYPMWILKGINSKFG